jgi:hypothetical protein
MADVKLDARRARAAPRGGVVDRAVGWLEGSPGTGVAGVIGAAVVLGLAGHLASWLSGETPVGEPRPELLFPLPFLAYFLTLIVVLDSVARSAFEEFRPALDEPPETIERLRADLTSIPDLAAAIAIIASVILNAASGQDATGATAEPPVTGTVLAALWFITISALGLLIAHTLGQLRQVRRLLARIAMVDLLDPGPINAFSRLTAATAGGILTIGVLFAVVDAIDPSSDTNWAGIVAELVFALIGVAFFVLPLRGVHRRLSAEKGRLLGEVNARLRLTHARIHRMVDADDLGRADDLQKTDAALLAERDLYLHLSTWPWSTGTFRALASAVMLPIFIGIILRVLSRVI